MRRPGALPCYASRELDAPYAPVIKHASVPRPSSLLTVILHCFFPFNSTTEISIDF